MDRCWHWKDEWHYARQMLSEEWHSNWMLVKQARAHKWNSWAKQQSALGWFLCSWQMHTRSNAEPIVQDCLCSLMTMGSNIWHASWWETKLNCTTLNHRWRDSWCNGIMQILHGKRSSGLHPPPVTSWQLFYGTWRGYPGGYYAKRTTIESETYVNTLQKLLLCQCHPWSNRYMHSILLPYTSAQLTPACEPWNMIPRVWWTV